MIDSLINGIVQPEDKMHGELDYTLISGEVSVVFNQPGLPTDQIILTTRSGDIIATRDGEIIIIKAES